MSKSLIQRLALGAAAGLAGTLAIRLAEMASEKWAPATLDPIRREPGRFFVQQIESPLPFGVRTKIPDVVENIAAQGMGYAYGMSFGALYAATRPEGGCVLVEGISLGLACWALGYLGWLPAIGIMNPIWKHEPAEIAGPIVRHGIYGLATVAAYDAIEKLT